MTNEEAIEHAKALQEFCRYTDCSECPFRSPFEMVEGITLCKLADYDEPPCGWELEEKE